MIHDLFLMHANLSLEAYTGRNFNNRALTFTEMAAFRKRREASASRRASRSARKNLFLAIIKG